MGYTGKAEVITFNGGYALRHFSDSIFLVTRLSNRNLTYTPVKIKADKTRSSRMGLCLDFPIGECGVDVVRDLYGIAVANGTVVVGGGGWTSYGDVKEQGEERFVNRLKSEPELYKSLLNDVYENVIDASAIICASVDSEEVIFDTTTLYQE